MAAYGIICCCKKPTWLQSYPSVTQIAAIAVSTLPPTIICTFNGCTTTTSSSNTSLPQAKTIMLLTRVAAIRHISANDVNNDTSRVVCHGHIEWFSHGHHWNNLLMTNLSMQTEHTKGIEFNKIWPKFDFTLIICDDETAKFILLSCQFKSDS